MAEDMIERAIEAYVANAMGGLPDQVALRAALLAALDPILVLIPTDLATDGDLSFWVKESDPAHNTTGRSMNEREHLKLTAYRVLSAMVKARDALDANAQGVSVSQEQVREKD